MEPGRSTSSTDTFKVCLLGQQGAGKASLQQALAGKHVDVSARPTSNPTTVSFNHQGYRIDMLHPGGARFRSRAGMSYGRAHACLLVFNLNSPATFEDLKKEAEQLLPHDEEDEPSSQHLIPERSILVGAQADKEGELTYSMAEKFRREHDGMKLIDVSAVQDFNVNELRDMLVEVCKASAAAMSKEIEAKERANDAPNQELANEESASKQKNDEGCCVLQ
eukprot:TRINITY_DN23236_c0_g1_i1.p1 TRINITY_DN23236_c0_g1~~TRINITY_DN23236_c0_g1_i1.p1  ORF type:complete len:221 (+),score=41.14 TRINITY_DN23236_c0_g1_i1:234-896(+)